jgi:para-nitrobenzyl esterase
MPDAAKPRPARHGARSTLRDGVCCAYGLRYGQLSDPANPRSAVVPAEGQIEVADITGVPVFPQLPSRLERVMGPGIRENPHTDDAFFLNVWAPEGARDLPVLVFLHGGAWVSGGGSARWYRGERLAREGMVVITVNYRLGPAGHLEDGQGGEHRPVGDLLAALGWVRESIRDYGGDPARVTLSGQSAGGWYAWAMAALPAAAGLFRRVALLSPPGITPWTVAERREFSARVIALRNDLLAEGEHPDTAELSAGAQVLAGRAFDVGTVPPMYLPVWPDALSDAATPLHVEALYVRTTEHEMSVFLPQSSVEDLRVLRERVGAITIPPAPPGWSAQYAETIVLASWSEFGQFIEQIAAAAEGRGIQVVRRKFMALSGLRSLGAAHCFDLPFQFGNLGDWHDAPMLAGWPACELEALSDLTVRDLAAFVKGEDQAALADLGEGTGPRSHGEHERWTA